MYLSFVPKFFSLLPSADSQQNKIERFRTYGRSPINRIDRSPRPLIFLICRQMAEAKMKIAPTDLFVFG